MSKLSKALLAAGAFSLIVTAAAASPVSPAGAAEAAGFWQAPEVSPSESELPEDLRAAIVRDLGMTAEEYLDAGQAALNAGTMIEELAQAGIAAADVAVAGTEVVAQVDNAAEAAAVEAYGARAVPRQSGPVDAGSTADAGADLTVPVVALSEAVPAGSKYLTPSYHACTLGFWGYDRLDRPVALTAGHCAKGSPGTLTHMTLNDPWTESGQITDEVVGTFHHGAYGSGYDVSLIRADAAAEVDGYVRVLDGSSRTRVPVLGWTAPVVGATVCKSGARTGWTCGVITDLPKDFVVADEGQPVVSGFSSTLCSAPGDSGAAILAGNYAVGILSFGSFNIKAGDSPAACDMAVQVERYKSESLSLYSDSQRSAATRLLDLEPGRLILTGAQAVTGPGQTVEALLGPDFRLAVALPAPKVTKKVASKTRTVIAGRIDLMGRAPADYAVSIKLGPRSYWVTPDDAGRFTVTGAKLKSSKKVAFEVRTHLVGDPAQKSVVVEKKIKPPAKKSAKLRQSAKSPSGSARRVTAAARG
jgi:hypothetical protein